MKSLKFFILSLSILSFGLTACNKDDDTGTLNAETTDMTEEEAATNMEALMVPTVENMETTMKMADEEYTETEGQFIPSCGVAIDTSWTVTYTRPNASASHNAQWILTVLCNQFEIPTGLAVNTNGSGNYEGILLSNNSSSTGSFEVDGLLPNMDEYIINGQLDAAGTATSKRENGGELNIELTVVFSDMIFDKENQELQSGSGTLTLTASTLNTIPVTFEGAVQFYGEGAGVIIINGNEYPFQL